MGKLPKFEDEKFLAESLKSPQALETYEKIIVGRAIRVLRKKLKLTQKQLAQKLKTTQSAVARMENGKQNLSLRILVNVGFLLNKKIQIRFL